MVVVAVVVPTTIEDEVVDRVDSDVDASVEPHQWPSSIGSRGAWGPTATCGMARHAPVLGVSDHVRVLSIFRDGQLYDHAQGQGRRQQPPNVSISKTRKIALT